MGAALIGTGYITQGFNFAITEDALINRILHYQCLTILLAVILIFIGGRFFPNGKELFSQGNPKVMAAKERWMGINGTTSWRKTSWQLLLFITLPTAIFMGLGVMNTEETMPFSPVFIPFILLFAAMNAFTEEIIFRYFLIAGLDGKIKKTTLCILSGVLFGLPHYWGAPGGPIGVVMAGILGYVLAKSTIETRGLGIAWRIHFVQDIVIFSALLLISPR